MNALSKKLNRIVLGALCVAPLLLVSASAFADEAPAAAAAPAEPASDFSLSYNLGLYSEYMFRGVMTADGPALQGGADLGHSSGLYAGTWWSNINPNYFGKDATPGARGNHIEADLYAGFAKSFENGFGVNFLANYYWYPEGHKNTLTNEKFDTLELSAALAYKWLTYTYYYTPTDYYGAKTSTGADTDGSEYHELKVTYALPFGGLNMKAKVGYTKTGDIGIGCGGETVICDAGQGDWALGINRDFAMPGAGSTSLSGFNAGLEYTQTFDRKNDSYYVDTNGKDLNGPSLWFYVKRTW